MRIDICDDVAQERKTLAAHLRRFEREQQLEMELRLFENAEALLAAYAQGPAADILFLDIYMDGISGMETAKQLYARGFSGSFVFCTTSREHGVESYAVNADGYLLKPYSWEDLCHAMENCRPRWQKSWKALSFTSQRVEMTVYLRDICYIETKRHGCTVHARGELLDTRKAMADFARELQEEAGFLPVGQSYLVNLAFMTDWDDEAIHLKNGGLVPLPVRERARFRRLLTDYQWLQMEDNLP